MFPRHVTIVFFFEKKKFFKTGNQSLALFFFCFLFRYSERFFCCSLKMWYQISYYLFEFSLFKATRVSEYLVTIIDRHLLFILTVQRVVIKISNNKLTHRIACAVCLIDSLFSFLKRLVGLWGLIHEVMLA